MIISFFVFLLGLVLGSFFNVLIYRLPKGVFFKNIRSMCPACGRTIAFYDNIPVLSFAVLGGKCRRCQAPISWRYPMVELLTALTAVSFFYLQSWDLARPWDMAWQAGASFILLFLIPISFIDASHRIIPDSLSLGGLAAALVLALLPQGQGLLQAFLGLLCGGGVLWVIALVGEKVLKKEAMGGGDIKLMAMAGALLGVKKVLVAMFLGSLAGAAAGIMILAIQKRRDIAFGPYLSLGIVITYLFGELLIEKYVQLLTPF